MDITLQPGKLRGNVTAIPSKSMAHRLLICAALADKPTQLICQGSSMDIDATIACLQTLGANIEKTGNGFSIFPISKPPVSAVLPCRESGSTLRFLLPIVGALGIDATFLMEGRLPQRPLSPLWEEMERMGCMLSRPTANTVHCSGKLRPGAYRIDGSVSSQFISGLLFALSLLPHSTLEIIGKAESKPYIAMTESCMALFHAPNHPSPDPIVVEGDWSNGAFWIAVGALDNQVSISGLNEDSLQGDRAIMALLPQLCETNTTISAADIPDLIPILAILAAAHHGATFTNIQRLRLKESDRVEAIAAMICALGGKAHVHENTLTIAGTGLQGGTVDSFQDHRIAMSAAIAATVCKHPVTILGAECVKKSYPTFWEEYELLGGRYVQFLR